MITKKLTFFNLFEFNSIRYINTVHVEDHFECPILSGKNISKGNGLVQSQARRKPCSMLSEKSHLARENAIA